MSDPRRLVDEMASEVSPAERRALASARADRPRADFVDGVWTGLLARLPPVGPAGDGSAPQGSASMGSGSTAGAGLGHGSLPGPALSATGGGVVGGMGVLKAGAIGAIIGTLALTGRAVVLSRATPVAEGPSADPALVNAGPVNAAPSVNVASPEELGVEGASAPIEPRALDGPVAVEPDPLPRLAEPAPRSASSVPRKANLLADGVPEGREARASDRASIAATANVVPTAVASADDARQETRLVASAREALRAGHVGVASGLLEQARVRFPRGVLLQEREALAIEALVQSGQRGLAMERAQSFYRNYPQSPHVARIRAVTAAP
ncbi:MAG TPA: hypothetical protein VJT73_16275 [Polyangiaceae bacterium]|nr:hypothetical protein [Polyangiaceae bacterium]